MMKRYYIAIIFLLILTVQETKAQQDAQYTQYIYNTLSVNPAYAGSRGVLSFAGLYRSQWVGLDGAPETQTLNVHSPVGKGKVGLGLSIVNDQIGDGVNQETYFDVAFSYTIQTSEAAKLSFGLKAGGQLLNIDFTRLNQFTTELVADNNIDNKFSPNIGLGLYYHTDKFYLGLSAPNLLETDHFDESPLQDATGRPVSYIARERINYYLIAGYVFNLNSSLKFKPAVLTKAVSGAPLQVDLSANFLFNDKFTFGAAYRWDAAFSGLFGFQISDSLLLGLAYDREITELGRTQFNDGSFEVFLRFELFKKVDKLVSPRFF
ncbi:type IX secretion system membrane protein PorP/SprF [Leptobacterium flavescens]|uniref:Type IX secretion system membrane protein PorP/SprF n=1 Tax=Leptobacterium flavescens TaxID=472055 RepID=A0A6P0UK86_9FLAO|nr:type IX secretion system membrane protein PorP/SprF [Leptobacterium flavescens]